MTIETIVLRELRMRLKAPFETSFGVTQNRRILLVEVIVKSSKVPQCEKAVMLVGLSARSN